MYLKQNMKPKHSFLIRVYDYLAALVFGVVSATAVAFIIPAHWPVGVMMITGMLTGMLFALPVLIASTIILGGFELLMMSMQIGMFAGMTGVMAGSDDVTRLILAGALTGIGIHLILHIIDFLQHGEVVTGDE